MTVLPVALPPDTSVKPPYTVPLADAVPPIVTLFSVLSFCLELSAVDPTPLVQPPYTFVYVPLLSVISFPVVVLPAFERPPHVSAPTVVAVRVSLKVYP